MSELSFLQDNTSNIPEKRNYWLIRAMGGDYYHDFYNNNYVAIGYDKVSLDEVKHAFNLGLNATQTLKEIFASKYPKSETRHDNINPSYAAAQLLRFCCEVQQGDVVIVPGKSHDKVVAIGIIESTVYEESDSQYLQICPFTKRLKVSWVKRSNRTTLNPQLQLLFNSRHIVSNANHYAQFIDSAIGNFYRKGDTTYLVLNVKTQDAIAVNDFLFIGDILSLVTEYSDENNLGINVDDIHMKVCVQSPGDIIIYAPSFVKIAIIGVFILLLINGGNFSIKKWGINLGTKGILHNISEFLDRRTDRKRVEALIQKVQTLKIDNPEDLRKLLTETQNPREKY